MQEAGSCNVCAAPVEGNFCPACGSDDIGALAPTRSELLAEITRLRKEVALLKKELGR
jgi:hypothetical protein